jgi:ATP-dependent RNA helicase DDX60
MQSSHLRGIIYSLIHRGLNVALLNGLDFRDSKVFAFILERSQKLSSPSVLAERADPPAYSPTKNGSPQICDKGHIATIMAALGPASTRLKPTLATLESIDGKFLRFLPAFLAHTLLLDSLPLTARRFAAVEFDHKTESAVAGFIDSWCDQLCQNTDTWIGREKPDASLVDVFDGRMFRHILAHSLDSLPAAISAKTSQLLRIITRDQLVHVNDCANPIAASVEESYGESLYGRETPSRPTSIMPFSHPAFDKHLQEIHVIVKETPSQQLHGNKISEELTHWHNAKKPLLIKRNAPVDPIAKARLMKSNQRFMAEMQSYAASLTNTTGKSLMPELILVGASNVSVSKALAIRGGEMDNSIPVKTKALQQKSSPQAGAKVKNEKFATESAKRAEAANAAVFGIWKNAREALDAAKTPEERYVRTKRYLADVTDRKDVSAIINDVELYKLSALLTIWGNYCKQSKRTEGLYVAALIYDAVMELSGSTLPLPRDASKILTDVATRMALDLKIKPGSLTVGNRSLSFSFDFPLGLSLAIDTDPRAFRLAHTGPYMDRSMDSKQDDRVSFVPDGWQRKVLDALDASRSILIVAPTSSGKTFISFYAIKKVLSANDEDVIVYVAPTKALVNQVAAEIIARFNKKYKHPGTSIYAIHTRDYRVNNPTKCQVLITVPHILQIMLLSPANQKWVPRVKTIIFDEVHTINQADDGVVWEQLLLMAPCQIIALSATVGNPEAFSDWLSSTQSTTGRQFDVVVYEHRFSDLRKYIFEGCQSFKFSKLPQKPWLAPLGLEDVEGFKYLHPAQSLRKGRMPTDLSLESRDCLLLWQAMKKCESPTQPIPSELEPSKFFTASSITKSDVIAWGGQLKTLLVGWMKSSEDNFNQVQEELGKHTTPNKLPYQAMPGEEAPVHDNLNRLDPVAESSPKKESSSGMFLMDGLLDSTLPLLCKLRSSNALPAILFNYNRSACENIVWHLRNQLFLAEQAFKQTDPGWKSKIKAFENWIQVVAKPKVKETKTKKSNKGGKGDRDGTSKLDLTREAADLEDHTFDGFNPLAPLDDFSFADPKRSNREELEKYIAYFKWRGIGDGLIDAFRRGIGVHHAGMNRKYRQAVEIFFRRGYLTVVVATGTLSLGINMPCKTVVFSGDSVFLTALNFRQASGRAGRRGFDLLGNVVFQEIGVDKACRLLSSRLPDLNGHFPLTTSFILRLLGLLHGTNNATYAMQMVNSLLSHPRLYLGGDSFRHQVLHHVRFSIEYLRSQGLVGSKGEPLNLSSCVSHLYFVEKGAFAFHALFRAGVFHQLSDAMTSNEADTLRSLMLIMSHLFGRVPMRAVDKESEKELIKRSASVVFLPKLPPEVANVLNQHNKDILATYQLYVKTYIEQHCPQPDMTLPFTKLCVERSSGTETVSLATSLPATKLRSPFIALSGQGDQFDSISDLCASVRDGVFLEKAVIPYLDMGEELATPLNAYLYDFYQHGQVEALELVNRIRRGDVWFVLKDFSLVLATLVASLENLFKAGHNLDLGLDLDLDLTTVGAVSDEIELEMDALEEKLESSGDKAMTNSSMTSSGATKANSTASKPDKKKQKAKKAKVVDSWEDDGDESSIDSKGEDTGSEAPQANGENTYDESERRLKRVLIMFKELQAEFDTKFRKIFA